MAEPARDDRRYRAFLSYSHRDSEIAERFHRDLERWRADRDLVGRETGRGEVPRDLRPVFRDRDDFAGGRTLADATAAALEQSDNLIVLCSPNAASSPYVNDEIRRFKAMGRADRIVPVIVAGEPGDPDEDCFPQALLRMVDAAGEFTDERVEPLAADAREQGDGPRRALAKVIAGLLDLPFDEIVRRAERAQRRRTRLIAATAGVMGVLAVLAGGFGWLAEARRVEAERNFEAARSAADDLLVEVGVQLLTIEGIPLDTSSRLIGRATDIYDGLMDSLPDAPDMKIRKAGALAAFANAYANKGSAGDARSALEEAEALLEDVVAATEDERREAARLILADVKANLGDVLRAVGETEAARARFASAVEIVTGGNPDAHPEGERALMATQTMMKLGLLEHDSGRAEEAALWLGRAENLIEAETAAHPEDPKWPALAGILLYERSTRTTDPSELKALNLAAGDKLETVLKDMPDFLLVRGALIQLLRGRLELLDPETESELVAATEARLAELGAELAAGASNQISVLVRAEGRITEALAAMEEGPIAPAIVVIVPALGELEAGLAQDPQNALIRFTTEWALSSVARAYNDAGLHADARGLAERLVRLKRARAAAAPEAEDALPLLAGALTLRAEALEGYGDMEAAQAVARERLEVERAIAAKDPSRRRAVATALEALALIAWRRSDRVEALGLMRERVEILAALAGETPEAPGLVGDLGWSVLNVGELESMTGGHQAAAQAFATFRQVAAANLEMTPGDAWRITDLAWAEARLAQMGDDPACRWPRILDLLREADAIQPLSDTDEELHIAASIAAAHQVPCTGD